jgi:hypothetical protein
MNTKIKKPFTREVRPAIGFLSAKTVRAAESNRQMVEVYADGAVKEGNTRKWCRLFKEGTTNLHDEERSGRPSGHGRFERKSECKTSRKQAILGEGSEYTL